jgi:hypothetical protein
MRKRKLFCAGVGIVLALALSAGAATANGARSQAVVFGVQNLGDASAECPGALFGLSFDMVSPAGALLGRGVSCVHFFEPPDGCPFGAVGCRDAVHATFTLDFAQGSLTAPIVLHEHWLTEGRVLQVDRGTVSSGTGRFSGERGSIFCAGPIHFTATDAISRIVCVVHLD